MRALFATLLLLSLVGEAEARRYPHVEHMFPENATVGQHLEIQIPSYCLEPLIFGSMQWVYHYFFKTHGVQPDLEEAVLKSLQCIGQHNS